MTGHNLVNCIVEEVYQITRKISTRIFLGDGEAGDMEVKHAALDFSGSNNVCANFKKNVKRRRSICYVLNGCKWRDGSVKREAQRSLNVDNSENSW